MKPLTSAIITLYNPPESSIALIGLSSSVDYCIFVDNSESVNNEFLYKANGKIIYHWMGGNKGIATAQNEGLRLSSELGVELTIFLDQDSEATPSIIDNLFYSFTSLQDEGVSLGVLGPRAYNKLTGVKYVHKDRDHNSNIRSIKNRYSPVEYTLSSGSVMNVEVIIENNGYMEDLFIDSVDHELCWRLAKGGLITVIDENILLPHMLGQYQKKILSYSVNIPSPIRHYYVFRNWFKLLRLSYVPLRFKMRILIMMPFKVIYFSFFAGKSNERIKYIFRGVVDGVLNNFGKYN